MKHVDWIVRLGLFGMLSIARIAGGQTNSEPAPAGPSAVPPHASGNPSTIIKRPVVIPPAPKPELPGAPAYPERPPVPERPAPAAAVKKLVRDFQTAREQYQKTQRDLAIKLQTATQQQRAAIRSELRDNLKNWLEIQKAHVEELRNQAREIKNNLPSIKDVIDSGKGEGRGRERR